MRENITKMTKKIKKKKKNKGNDDERGRKRKSSKFEDVDKNFPRFTNKWIIKKHSWKKRKKKFKDVIDKIKLLEILLNF